MSHSHVRVSVHGFSSIPSNMWGDRLRPKLEAIVKVRVSDVDVVLVTMPDDSSTSKCGPIMIEVVGSASISRRSRQQLARKLAVRVRHEAHRLRDFTGYSSGDTPNFVVVCTIDFGLFRKGRCVLKADT